MSENNIPSSEDIKVAFLVLCHGSVAHIKELVTLDYFENPNIRIYLHYDKSQPAKQTNELKTFIDSVDNVFFVEDRVKCGWGEYSLVEGTLNAMKVALNDEEFNPDYVYLISAACLPIKPFRNLQNFLSENYNKEFIQANDVRYIRWVANGWDKERLWYYFPFNWNTQRWLFQKSCDIQQRLKIHRKLPIDMDIYFGSQWFCLTKETCKQIVEIMSDKKIERFFRYVWIPDEYLIQSLTVKVAGLDNVPNRNLTYFQFNTFGRPLTMHNDHIDHLKKQPHFFARKISGSAKKLRSYLASYTAKDSLVPKKTKLSAVGLPSKDYELNNLRYLTYKREAKIGKIGNSWNEGVEKNYKPYWVITGPCKYMIQKMLKDANSYDILNIYGYLFNRFNLIPSEVSEHWKGFSPQDIKKRDLDPIAFLYQVIHSTEKKVCFAMDPDEDPDHVREVVRWDHNANVLVVEPHWSDQKERAVSYLTEQEATSLLDIPVTELNDMINALLSKKKKYYWLKVMNKDHNAKVSWLEDGHGLFPYLFKKLKQNNKQESYLPEPNIELYNRLSEEVDLDFHISL